MDEAMRLPQYHILCPTMQHSRSYGTKNVEKWHRKIQKPIMQTLVEMVESRFALNADDDNDDDDRKRATTKITNQNKRSKYDSKRKHIQKSD